ncbi:hypothetical protein BH747_00540 [Enterococcus villorum]|uniref:UPF0291 protein BH747_00540 n=2 Tax=Enterococcus villorum TaxID=112904 RepID=A0A1V8YUQ4_9ENTE|nr:DUF896 family protein [Enterococcus villorum]EOH89872.1 hypothetical protein UAO_01116 [Enterococcus villorum ATCC 700913]EOW78104.1 hypothetical protein I591_00959 [Enterococcus villorum ATCC 700913]OQO71353.1 hypothetical protein BH747_00540 [Enterococcus villorum]OQO76324.1 hypothetical protein BH744_03585 [Enterococcus villorum]GEL90819.1 UPF0291 protein [Enterococcus villorum]
MLSPEKIARINELAQKKKKEGLTEKEEKEQFTLREEYLTAFRSGMRHHIEGMKVVDPKGNDVTPNKLKEIQKKKGLHSRGNKFE